MKILNMKILGDASLQAESRLKSMRGFGEDETKIR